MRRLTTYVAGSLALATTVVSWAALERPNFYSAAVYLSQSNACLMILCNLALVVAGGAGYGLQQALFGPLRAAEVEQLWERSWFAVMEWVFAMSTFRDEFGVWFLTMFLSLFGGKVWGWIAEGRVEQLEQQPPINGRLLQPRLIASLVIYLVFAAQMFWYTLDIVMYEARPGMTVMFVFEFVILVICAVSTCVRYFIWIQEHRILKQQMTEAMEARRAEIRTAHREAEARASSSNAETGAAIHDETLDENDIDESEIDVPGWDAKKGWLFVLDITTDLLKLLAYIAFFTILTVFYGIPIYIIRDLYMTVRSFSKRITDYIKYQAATRDMHARYPDATAEEMASDNTCIVCREEMKPWGGDNAQTAAPGTTTNERQRPKKLPCGHILHFSCLQSWLERQQSCPTCRRSVFAAPTVREGQAPRAVNAAAPVAGGNDGNAVNVNPRPAAPAAAPAIVPAAARPNNRWTWRLGPFRLQIGARMGRRDHQQDLLDILGRIARERAARDPSANEAGNSTHQAENMPRNIGATAANAHPALRSATTNAQLSIIEAQLRQEIAALNVASNRLATVQALERELSRLRTFPGRSIMQPPTLWGGQGLPQPSVRIATSPIPIARAQQMDARSVGNVPHSHNLPDGMILPAGWTLVPLTPITGQAAQSPSTMVESSSSGTTVVSSGENDRLAAPSASTSAPRELNGTSTPSTAAAPHSAPTEPRNLSTLQALNDAAPAVTAPFVPTDSWGFPSNAAASATSAGEESSPKRTADTEPHVDETNGVSGSVSETESRQPTIEDVHED